MGLESFLIPPRGNTDGASVQPEPKSLAEELAEETSRVRQSALKDAVYYITENAVNNTACDVRWTVQIRYNLPFKIVDEILAKAERLAVPEIEKARKEWDRLERERTEFESLVALFDSVGLQIEAIEDRYKLSGLSELQIRSVAEILTGANK